MRFLPAVLMALLGLAALALALAGYPAARGLLDPLAGDGSFEALTPGLYAFLRWPLLLTGLAALALAGWLFLRPLQVRAAWRSLWGGFPRLAALLKLEHSQWLALLALSGLALVVRIPFLARPFGHDEAYTYVAFARRSVWALLSDYHLPNNHVLHSLLVHFSTGLLGDAPWAVRLPALVAGVLCVPAAYALARAWSGPRAGLLAAGLLGVTPLLIGASSDARGYTLLILLSLLCWALGSHLRTHANPAGWGLLALLGALGFFTVPVMLYPLGSLYAWLFLSALVDGRIRQTYGGLGRYTLTITAAGLLTGLLAILFYTPVLVVSGPQALFANPFVRPLAWVDFPATLADRLSETWQEWQLDVPPVLTLLTLLGVALELGLCLRSRKQVPVLGGVLAWMVPVMLVQRPNPWRKTWYWLLALLLVLAAIGWATVLERVRTVRLPRGQIANLGTAVILVALAAVSLPYAVREGARLAEPWASERVAESLASRLLPGEIVAVDPWHAPPVWYYLLRAGQPAEVFERIHLRTDYPAVYVVTAPGEPDSDLASVLARAGPLAAPPDLQTCVQVEDIPPYRIYRCE
jgi:hypothetical protein